MQTDSQTGSALQIVPPRLPKAGRRLGSQVAPGNVKLKRQVKDNSSQVTDSSGTIAGGKPRDEIRAPPFPPISMLALGGAPRRGQNVRKWMTQFLRSLSPTSCTQH